MRFILLVLVVTGVAFAVPKKDRMPAMASANKVDELGCVSEQDGTYLVLKKDGAKLNLLRDRESCETIVKNAKDGIYCRYHLDATTLGKEAKQTLGWFPTSLKTQTGIGSCPAKDLPACLDLITKSAYGVLCTNTCTGWAVTNVETREPCGSSVTLDWCMRASEGAAKDWVCSYPGDGGGFHKNWVTTRIGAKCSYEGSPQSLDECKTALLKKK